MLGFGKQSLLVDVAGRTGVVVPVERLTSGALDNDSGIRESNDINQKYEDYGRCNNLCIVVIVEKGGGRNGK